MGKDFIEKLPKKHQITIFEKKGRREIKKLKEMVELIRNIYGQKLEIKVVNPAKIDFKTQIQIMLETTLLISPCGRKNEKKIKKN